MTVYLALARLFPRSFTAKVFFLAFVGTHVPLIALATYLFGLGGGGFAGRGDVLLLVLVATLVGTGATLAALQAILRPVYRVEAAMQRFEEAGVMEPLPLTLNDELGRLMRRTDRLMHQVRLRIDDTQRSADTDPLTGLLNRRGFDRRLAQDGRQPGAVIHFDLDRFKAINDRLGHDGGDAVLVQVAGAAARVLRGQDLLARFGGEEFVAFLPGADRAEAQQVAERLRTAIAARVRAGDAPVTASFGIATGPGAAAESDVADLIRRADLATYASKRDGRDRVTLAA